MGSRNGQTGDCDTGKRCHCSTVYLPLASIPTLALFPPVTTATAISVTIDIVTPISLWELLASRLCGRHVPLYPSQFSPPTHTDRYYLLM